MPDNRNNNRQNGGAPQRPVLKAPFNFVPLPTQCAEAPFLPDWGDKVSLDYPFSDGVSGKITLKITAQTDIFVRNSNADSSFHNVKNNYFIPGSSIKGALRSVLEIATLGKLTQFNNSSFSFRDLNNTEYRALIQDISAGWLYLHNDEYYIYDCGGTIDVESDRITAKEIDREIGRSVFEDFVLHGAFNNDANRNAKKKYELLYGEGPEEIERRTDFFYQLQSGCHAGKYLVMTGQPGRRDEQRHKGKNKEFVFPEIPPTDDSGRIVFEEDDECWFKLSPEEVNAFKSIHKNSEDYVGFWEKVLKRGGAVPVFFRFSNGNSGRRFLGLSYMFKYPAKHNVSQAIPERFRTCGHDMAELMFGYIGKDDALKGRVHVGHAFASKAVASETEETYALSSPKPSYYPLYLKGKSTWNSQGEIEILGRKRYPTRESVYRQNVDDISTNMLTRVRPLKAGSEFLGEITFHNLKPVELGALLYVITELRFHQLGGLKPYGYGKVQMVPQLTVKGDGAADIHSYVSAFRGLISGKYSGWNCAIKELHAMASGISAGYEHKFKYMQMSTRQNENEFNTARKNREPHLAYFSDINPNNKNHR
jgi:CRISPR-associated protein (TIGR03986 family)